MSQSVTIISYHVPDLGQFRLRRHSITVTTSILKNDTEQKTTRVIMSEYCFCSSPSNIVAAVRITFVSV